MYTKKETAMSYDHKKYSSYDPAEEADFNCNCNCNCNPSRG